MKKIFLFSIKLFNIIGQKHNSCALIIYNLEKGKKNYLVWLCRHMKLNYSNYPFNKVTGCFISLYVPKKDLAVPKLFSHTG